MKGILLPVKERHEQINKFGYDAKHDASSFHKRGGLLTYALFFLTGDEKLFPQELIKLRKSSWSKEYHIYKRKTYVQRIVVAIALLMAEVDRLTGSKLLLPDLQLRRAEYKKGPDQFYYVILAKNGQVLATSEQYTRRASARRACKRLNDSIGSYLQITDATAKAIPFPELEKKRAA